jgi:hypothetical protein
MQKTKQVKNSAAGQKAGHVRIPQFLQVKLVNL